MSEGTAFPPFSRLGGKISKLSIKIDGEYTANYDRGWDIEPAEDDEATQIAYCILLTEYN